MAYTTPRTWVAGEYPTAAQFNAHIRDNIAWLANPPTVRVRQTVTQSIPNATWTALTFTVEDWDTDGMHDTATNTTRLTAPTAGRYWVYGAVAYAPNATNSRLVGVRLSGTGANPPTRGATFQPTVTDGNNAHVHFATEVSMTAGQYVEFVTYQNSGGALSTTVDSGDPHFGMRWVGTA